MNNQTDSKPGSARRGELALRKKSAPGAGRGAGWSDLRGEPPRGLWVDYNRPAERLLSRLSGVKKTGDGRWSARCPAHDDKAPSLAIRELDDGRILLHDFGGCAAADVLAAVGLSLPDLYPDATREHHRSGERRPFPAADILRVMAHEALVVAMAAEQIGKGDQLGDLDRERVLDAAERIRLAAMLGGAA